MNNIIENDQGKSSLVSRTDLIESVKKWVLIDSQLKIVNEKTKIMRENKSNLTETICTYMKANNIQQNKIGISDGELSIYEKKGYSPLTYKYVEKCLAELISDEKQVEYIIQYMKSHREIEIEYDIRRTYKK